MISKIETIDTEKAILYLSRNMVNRSVRQKKVDQYADMLVRGEWQLNGEAIKFNSKGEMIDGQHRLNAIIKCGVPMTTLVIFDVDDKVSLLDRGTGRNVTDSLIIEGMSRSVVNTTTVAIAKLFYEMQTGNNMASDGFVREWLKNNQDDVEEIYSISTKGVKASSTKSLRTTVRNAPMLLAMFYAKKVEVPISELYRFAEVFATGFYDNRSETSAIVLRNDIVSKAIDIGKGGRTRVYATYKVEKALYDFHRGIERKKSYRSVDKPTYSNNSMFQI